jgi:hypothetical protein
MNPNAQANVRLRPFFYSYSIPFTAANGNQLGAAAGTTLTATQQIEAGHHFVIQQLIFDCRLAATPDLNPSITVQIVDLSANLPMFDRPLPISSMFGTSQLPFVLPVPRRFRANGGIQATVVNVAVGAARDVTLIFAGQKVPVAGAGAGAQD